MDAEHLPCQTAHEILSAQLDGEATEPERERLNHHLTGCEECRQVSAQYHRLDRRVRLRSAESVPDLRPAIFSRSRPAVLGRNGWMRPALAWVAFVLVVQNVMALVAGEMNGAEVHLARHLGAFGVALGVGLAFVAWRPHRAHGLLPFAGALIATMMLSAIFDIVENRAQRGLRDQPHRRAGRTVARVDDCGFARPPCPGSRGVGARSPAPPRRPSSLSTAGNHEV